MLRSRIIQSDLGGSHLRERAGAISPMLLLITMGRILWIMGRSKVKLGEYADGLMISVSGMLSVMGEIMEGVFVAGMPRAARCEPGINATRTELILYATKTRVPVFHHQMNKDCVKEVSGCDPDFHVKLRTGYRTVG